MTDRLVGKTALIVGADAISAAITARYVAEGATVFVAADRNALMNADLPDLAETLEIGSTASEDDKAAIAKAAGRSLDILVLGGDDIPEAKDWVPVAELGLETMADAQNRLVGVALMAVQACESALKMARRGSIIFLYSPNGWFSDAGWTDRSVAYHARHGLMRSIAGEWGPVRANVLVPYADTPGFRAFRERNPDDVDFRVRTSGMGRIGDLVNDIGGAAVFMGSDDTQYLNGMIVHADGGAHMTAPVIETKMRVASNQE